MAKPTEDERIEDGKSYYRGCQPIDISRSGYGHGRHHSTGQQQRDWEV